MLHCPKCGMLSFDFDGEKHFHCKSCDYQFYFNSAATVGALIVNDGQLLTVVRANEPGQGLLDLPGGFVDPGESLEEALERELQEELSIRPTAMKYFASSANRYLFNGVEYITCDAFFVCDIEHFRDMKASDDISQYRWITLGGTPLSDFAFDSVKQIITRLAQLDNPGLYD